MGQKVVLLNVIRDFSTGGGEQILNFNPGYCALFASESRNFPDVNFFELNREPLRSKKIEALSQWMKIQSELKKINYIRNQRIISEPELRDCLVDNSLADTFRIGDNFFNLNWTEEDLTNILCAQGFNPEKKTLVIFEGLSSFSEEDSLLLNQLGPLLSAESQILMGFATDDIPEVQAFALKHALYIAEKMLHDALPPLLQDDSIKDPPGYFCFKKGVLALEKIPNINIRIPVITPLFKL